MKDKKGVELGSVLLHLNKTILDEYKLYLEKEGLAVSKRLRVLIQNDLDSLKNKEKQ